MTHLIVVWSSNMDLKAVTLLVLFLQLNVTHSTHVSGSITENTVFVYRKLPVAPSVSTIIEFSVSYSPSAMGYKFPLTGIYTNYPKVNIGHRCSFIEYGQLGNLNLHPYLKLGRYRTTTCELSGSDTVNCSGRVNVQDYIPRNFYLTFGFHCNWPRIYSLQGLTYNISFFDQNNGTSDCIDYSVIPRSGVCSRFYKKTSLPNLIGDEDLEHYEEYFKQSTFVEALLFMDGTCYQHVWEVVCHIILPKCDPVTKQVTHPCREMFWDLLKGCEKKCRDLLGRMGSEFRHNSPSYVNIFLSTENLKWVNCDYLPSIHSNVSCFYKPVTCDSPLNGTNSTVMVNTTQKDVYQLHDVVQYACVNVTFEMRGTSSMTCLYSGEWSHPPPRCIAPLKDSMNPLLVILTVLIIPLMIYTNLVLCVLYRKTKIQTSIRDKQYDAFVCYCYEAKDSDFAEKTIPQELEHKRGFRLCVHRRDFKAGWDIKWNIMNAIRNSNSAIIIMSQDYINSLWCVEEFEDCYMENMKDPAFKLFVVLMQPVDTLDITNEYIKSFFTKKTYLERDDPKLFKKIAEYLVWVKQPKGWKSPPEGNIDDTFDPLFVKNDNKNKDEIADKIMMDDYKRNIKLLKIPNDIEVEICSEDSDEESIISSSQSDDDSSDEFLSVVGLNNNF